MKQTDILTFGKYKGSTYRQVADKDPAYLVWVYENCTHFKHGGVSKSLYLGCQEYLMEAYEDGSMDWMPGNPIDFGHS